MLIHGKVPHIIVHKVEFISLDYFVEVYKLNHQGRWPKNLKVLKDLQECEVEALIGSIVTIMDVNTCNATIVSWQFT